ncbi:hypothetical protein HDE_09805 [Halotydeus destructor]|nr:hypothetical protein HDE_09805 [Halotydeus destructor]
MRGWLFLFSLIALANCLPTLNAIIDAKLKQYENDAKMNTASISGSFEFSYGIHRYHYSLKLFGVSRNVKRTSEATVTKMEDGALVQWEQQEPDLRFNGSMTSVIDGQSSSGKVTGSIARNIQPAFKFDSCQLDVLKSRSPGMARVWSRGWKKLGLGRNQGDLLITSVKSSPRAHFGPT